MLARSRNTFDCGIAPDTVYGMLAACARDEVCRTLRIKRFFRSSSSSGSDYYLLALSWAPQFCATHAGNASSSECDPGRHFGFVVHGLWPQNDDGSYPQNCAPARPVAEQTVRRMLAIMPARGLIQHEWAEHGTCSGLSPQEYFAKIEKAFAGVQIPPEYRAPAQTISASPSEIEQKFAAANRAPTGAFRVSCSHAELVELKRLPDQGPALSRMWSERARVPRPAGNGSTSAVTSGNGRPGWNRTSNPQLRRLMLYPLELRARGCALQNADAPIIANPLC